MKKLPILLILITAATMCDADVLARSGDGTTVDLNGAITMNQLIEVDAGGGNASISDGGIGDTDASVVAKDVDNMSNVVEKTNTEGKTIEESVDSNTIGGQAGCEVIDAIGVGDVIAGDAIAASVSNVDDVTISAVEANGADSRFQITELNLETGKFAYRLAFWDTEGRSMQRTVVATVNYEQGYTESDADTGLELLGIERPKWVRNIDDRTYNSGMTGGAFGDFSLTNFNLLKNNRLDILYYAVLFANPNNDMVEPIWIRGKLDYRSCAHSTAISDGLTKICSVRFNNATGKFEITPQGSYVAEEAVLTWEEEKKLIVREYLQPVTTKVIELEAKKAQGANITEADISYTKNFQFKKAQDAAKNLQVQDELQCEIDDLALRLENLTKKNEPTQPEEDKNSGNNDNNDKKDDNTDNTDDAAGNIGGDAGNNGGQGSNASGSGEDNKENENDKEGEKGDENDNKNENGNGGEKDDDLDKRPEGGDNGIGDDLGNLPSDDSANSTLNGNGVTAAEEDTGISGDVAASGGTHSTHQAVLTVQTTVGRGLNSEDVARSGVEATGEKTESDGVSRFDLNTGGLDDNDRVEVPNLGGEVTAKTNQGGLFWAIWIVLLSLVGSILIFGRRILKRK